MHPTTSLIDHDFVFTQQTLLTTSEFLSEANNRNIKLFRLGDGQLEALHRTGALIPFFRVKKNIQVIKKLLDHQSSEMLTEIRSMPKHLISLRKARSTGAISDPRQESFRAWHRYLRRFANTTYRLSDFLYSPYQILHLHCIQSYIEKMKPQKRGDEYHFRLMLSEQNAKELQMLRNDYDALAIILSFLEPIYRPQIVQRYSGNFEEWRQFIDRFDVIASLNWTGWMADQILNRAEYLINKANTLDPLARWIDLLRLCDPGQWTNLRGDALIAIDFRIAAEMLFLFYEDLVKVNKAAPMPVIPRLSPHPVHSRLTNDREELDQTLMKYRLSPQPSLVLFVEGETELMIVPRVIKLLELPLRRSFIEIHLTRGWKAHIGNLAMFVARPELQLSQSKHILFTRPPTHFLFMVDPEGDFSKEESIAKKKREWINSIANTLKLYYGHDVSKNDLSQLVEVITWGEGGSFEFAHYSDREIKEGIENVCRELNVEITLPITENEIALLRNSKSNQNIEHLWARSSKAKKAGLTKLLVNEELWPILEKKVRTGVYDGTAETIPIVRTLQYAIEIASRVHRGNVMIRRADEDQ